jgi:hypothetical protein
LQPNAQPSALRLPPSLIAERASRGRYALRQIWPNAAFRCFATTEEDPRSEHAYWRPDVAPPGSSAPRAYAWCLREWGLVILAGEYLQKADRSVVEQAVKQLGSAEREVLALLSKTSDAASARKVLEHVAAIAGSAYVVGAHGGMTETQRVFFKAGHAMHMRIRRATSSKEHELRAAIEASAAANNIAIPSRRSYKDAERILTDVNQRLLGHKPVSVDVIARRRSSPNS